jgi:hypothetical protein
MIGVHRSLSGKYANGLTVYVDFDFAQETAKKVKNCKQYITNSMYHNAIRAKTEDIMKELFALRDDSID